MALAIASLQPSATPLISPVGLDGVHVSSDADLNVGDVLVAANDVLAGGLHLTGAHGLGNLVDGILRSDEHGGSGVNNGFTGVSGGDVLPVDADGVDGELPVGRLGDRVVGEVSSVVVLRARSGARSNRLLLCEWAI